MIQKKVCAIGAFAVGKTSLIRRFVDNLFSEKYHTTIGVKVDQKSVQLDGTSMKLLVWDIAGEDEFQSVRMAYLRGLSGLILVADSTRPQTLKVAVDLQARVDATSPNVPFVLLLNKSDLGDQAALDSALLESLEKHGWLILKTSAKSGEGVEDAFLHLTRMMLKS